MIYLFGFIILYIIIIFSFFLGWGKLNYTTDESFTPSVSVVIALRNEEHQVNRLLNNLRNLDYPHNLVQYILVNDHSTDNTFNLLLDNKSANVKIINMFRKIQFNPVFHSSPSARGPTRGLAPAPGRARSSFDTLINFTALAPPAAPGVTASPR